MDTIGIVNCLRLLQQQETGGMSRLQRDFMLVDRIVLLDVAPTITELTHHLKLARQLDNSRAIGHLEETLTTLNYLLEDQSERFLSEICNPDLSFREHSVTDPVPSTSSGEGLGRIVKSLQACDENIQPKRVLLSLADGKNLSIPDPTTDWMKYYYKLEEQDQIWSSHSLAEKYRQRGYEAFSMDTPPIIHDGRSKLFDVIQVCLKSVPVPDENIAWEDILELHQDSDFRDKARRLRLWARDISKKEMSPAETKDYIDTCRVDYENCLRQKKIDFRYSAINVFLSAAGIITPEFIIERFRKLSSDFAVIHRQSSAIPPPLEMNSGSELAVLAVLNQNFDR